MDQQIENILYLLEELSDDDTVPRNVKAKMQEMRDVLQEGEDMEVRKNKALHKLEELSEDSNLKNYTRSQLMELATLLEGL